MIQAVGPIWIIVDLANYDQCIQTTVLHAMEYRNQEGTIS